jgi:pimeloyl-ACP methyl ester carboxylesterase
MPTTAPHVVLVHGGFVDGSGWRGVHDRLTADGHTVTVVQNPTISLEGDVATTKEALDAHDSPAILVGHSYGGAVITEAGNHPAVKALVYRMIPPPAQRAMCERIGATTVEVAASHAVYLSQPDAVAALISAAAEAVTSS